MKQRPLLLKLAIIFLLFEPLMQLIILTVEKNFQLSHIFYRALTLNSFKDLFNFWLLFPLSALFLFSTRSIFFYLYIILQIYNIFYHLSYDSYTWPYLDEHPSLTAWILLTINIFILIYLLTSKTRKIFFNKDLRWWEQGHRFVVSIPCYLSFIDSSEKGTIVDLSFSGALLKTTHTLSKGVLVAIDFVLLGKSYSMNAMITRTPQARKQENVELIASNDHTNVYGVRFIFNSIFDQFSLRLLLYKISRKKLFPKYR
ncbi:MAG: PilZ domain-containing protein [Oligoflexia bacterium]|nr:PilZ domain-containing protein [Oligoflexia bacterium]